MTLGWHLEVKQNARLLQIHTTSKSTGLNKKVSTKHCDINLQWNTQCPGLHHHIIGNVMWRMREHVFPTMSFNLPSLIGTMKTIKTVLSV